MAGVAVVVLVAPAVGLLGGAGPAAGQRVTGEVVDARAAVPVAGAEIILLTGALQPVARGRADKDGRFYVIAPTGIRASYVSVSAPGYSVMLSDPLPIGAPAVDLAVELTPVGSGPGPREVEVSPAEVASWCGGGFRFEHDGIVVGHVTDRSTGEGLTGVEVVAAWGRSAEPLRVGGPVTEPRRSTSTGIDGLYLFCDLPAGSNVDVRPRVGRIETDSAAVRIEAGSVHNVNLTVSLTRPGKPAAIFGAVVDRDSGRPVANARVYVTDDRRWTLTSDVGFFSLDSVPSGLQILSVEHLAYAERQLPVFLEAGKAGQVQVEMAVDPIELAPLRVVVQSRHFLRDMRDFEHRRSLGFGAFFTRQDLDERMPWMLGDLLREVPGMQVRIGSISQPVQVRVRGRWCLPAVFVDGIRWRGGDALREVMGYELEAVEVYKGPAGVPAEYTTIDNDCGVVAAWTKRGGG